LLISLAAHLATAPLIAYRFGTFSVIAPIANLIVLPFVPFLMLGGILAACFGAIVPSFALSVSAPISWLLGLTILVIQMIAGIPHVSLTAMNIAFEDILITYGILGVLGALIVFKTSQNTQEKL
ncbi:MAG: ComEC/Rec2 family competence protein, partial [bacterium]